VAKSKLDPWRLIDAAENHGRESDPDHEVGDLQDALILCFQHMFPDQKERVFGNEDTIEKLKRWGPDE
jgi:hypothetical protein